MLSQVETEGKKPKSKMVGCLSLLVICFSLVAIISMLGDSEPKKEHSPASASVMAEQFVKEKLKSPSSAKFQPFTEQNIKDLGDGRYQIRAYVDSQNSFGAMIRTHYGCTIKYTGNDNWQLENLEFVE